MPYTIRPAGAPRIIEDDLVAGLTAAPAWPTFARDAQAAQVAATAAPQFLWGHDAARAEARVGVGRPVARPRARPLTAAEIEQQRIAIERLRRENDEEEGDF